MITLSFIAPLPPTIPPTQTLLPTKPLLRLALSQIVDATSTENVAASANVAAVD